MPWPPLEPALEELLEAADTWADDRRLCTRYVRNQLTSYAAPGGAAHHAEEPFITARRHDRATFRERMQELLPKGEPELLPPEPEPPGRLAPPYTTWGRGRRTWHLFRLLAVVPLCGEVIGGRRPVTLRFSPNPVPLTEPWCRRCKSAWHRLSW